MQKCESSTIGSQPDAKNTPQVENSHSTSYNQLQFLAVRLWPHLDKLEEEFLDAQIYLDF